MSSSEGRRQRRQARKLEAHTVKKYPCPYCDKWVFFWPGKAKVTHETPFCEAFERTVLAVADKHGLQTEKGESYPALIIEPSESGEPTN